MAKLTLEELVTQLKAAFGDDLKSVVLYGSAAGGDHGKHSDQNVLVIVRQVPMSAATAIAATSRAWGEAGNPPPLVFTEEEWRGSSDIFPMEYADILDRNRVLYGSSPLDGIAVKQQDLRLQLEHEAMGKLLHLRQAVLANAGDGKQLIKIMRTTATPIMVIFRSVCRLHGQVPERDNAQVIHQVAQLVQLDPMAFHSAVRLARGENAVSAQDALGVTAAYVAGLERLVSHLDRFQG